MSETVELEPGPWERWAWVMAAVWLVFLAFPLLGVLTGDGGTVAKALGVVGIVAFGALYVAAFVEMGRRSEDDVRRWAPWCLAVLTALAAGVVALAGPGALGMAVFLVCFAVFALPAVPAAVITVTTLVGMLVVPLLVGVLDEMWVLLPIITLVAVFSVVVRVLETRQHEHRALQDQVTIVAERERVARDVHDVLGHSLTVVTVKAELAERLVDRDPERAKHEMAQVQSLAREALAEVRATVAGLRIARLADELDAAREVLDDAGIEAVLPGAPSVVDPRHRLVLAWVLREAVTNVVRHSGAGRCDIRLEAAALTVLDDGRGGAGSHGNGLRGIAERVRAAGGSLEVGDGPDGVGTRLEVRWA